MKFAGTARTLALAAPAILWTAALSSAPVTAAEVPAHADGAALFEQRCKACHDPAVDRAPTRAALATMRPSHIVESMTTGVMAPMSAGLSTEDRTAIATFLTRLAAAPSSQAGQGGAARQASTEPAGADRFCATNPPIRATATDWRSVGFDSDSTRYNPNPGLKDSDVPRLKVKWAFAMPGGSMPTVVGDWLFIANRSGKLYALDSKTGCVRWVQDAVSRTTPMVIQSPISPSGWLTIIGERNRTVRAIDAQTGKDIWKSEALDPLPVAGITGTPVIFGQQVFVPLTSGEEGTASQDSYECCRFQGSLAALDLRTGKKLWQTKTLTEPLRSLGKNSAGTPIWGPAGGAVWSAPTVDARRRLVYVATGDSYTEAPTKGADAIVAMDMATGRIRWSNQVTENDNFIMRCNAPKRPANCPKVEGPDYDFGASPILFKLKSGKDVLLVGQKSGIVYGMDPDSGRTLWTQKVGSGGALGGIEWGMTSDGERLYAPNSDLLNLVDQAAPGSAPATVDKQPPKPGLYALDPATGRVLWQTPAPKAPCVYAGDRSKDYAKGACIRAQSAAASTMPGVVFSGTTDGWFRAYDAKTGKIIWEHSTTAQTYETVNGVSRQPGGSIDGMGPAIAGGMVYTMSGFNGAANTGGNGVNVLLAYSVDGR